ncbi:MAG: hypothetical protein JNK21_02630 [Rhodospirillaceae bacterium]|nr:hypothetical protein [Rhodospirillaceae bacterium]
MKKFLMTCAVLATFAYPALAAENITTCDKLAAHPEDPDRIAPGVDKVPDLKAAIAACEADVAKDMNNRRLRYQLARVLFYDQQTEKSLPHLRFAADAGSQQAQFVLGYIIDEALQGVKREPCKVEDLWLKSARQGRMAAQISYPHHVINNMFEGCKVQASPAEMDDFLAKAKQNAKGYYPQLLVKTIIADYTRFKAGK